MSSEATPSNPFISRRIRPGALEYLFAGGETVDSIVQRLDDLGWRGEIIGPHGSGKSTLLHSIKQELVRRCKPTVDIVLRAGQSSLPRDSLNVSLTPKHVIVIDGYEQLSRWQRFRLRRLCNRTGCGLVVTTHAPTGLPQLLRTAPSLEVTQQLVRQLQEGFSRLVQDDDVVHAFHRRDGNIREVLFDLYDVYEERRQQSR